jgi:hypothetical protein
LHQIQAAREDWAGFQRLVELAVEAGGTHVQVGVLPFKLGTWVQADNRDPYASWCNNCHGLFRLCPPPELQPWVLASEAERCQAFIRRQLDYLRPHGLKGTLSAIEPMWLPEGVYRAHPTWRGAQCELGRIALAPYWAPSIDEPEVLALYRQAAQQFATLFPEVDFFEFMGNDSGAGIAWTPCIYPGMNGPAKHRRRDGGERIATWLQTLQEGFGEAGVKARVHLFSSGFPPELTASVRAKLGPGLCINWQTGERQPFHGPGAGLSSGLWSLPYPALGLGDSEQFLGDLQKVYHNPKDDQTLCRISLHACDLEWGGTLLRTALATPGQGLLARTQATLAAATTFAGSAEAAERLVGAWGQVRQAVHCVAQIRQKGFGHVLNFCTVSMRWLTRPLVPQPERLTATEMAHYLPWMFAAGDQKRDPDFGLVLGKSVFNGESVTWMSRWCLEEACGHLRGARATLEALAAEAPDEAVRARLALQADRVGALACLVLNARNIILYKYALDTASQPLYGPNQTDYDDNIVYDQRALSFRKIAREEHDAIAELITILERQPAGAVLEQAAQPGDESVFVLGPALVAQLRRKLEIMMDHWQDYETLYPATKVYDFEPHPRGNLVAPGGPSAP